MISTGRGSIINASGSKTIAKVFNSTFHDNSAFYGGIAHLEKYVTMTFNHCTFCNNFAIMSGLFDCTERNYLNITNSVIVNNTAFANAILHAEFI